MDSRKSLSERLLCKVCGESGAGFHYGVNTCGACKGFFRRSLMRVSPYVCDGSGSCQIGPEREQRKKCPKCRWEKCVAVGMSREAIRIGRYTFEKRSNDIQEILVEQSDHRQNSAVQGQKHSILTRPSIKFKWQNAAKSLKMYTVCPVNDTVIPTSTSPTHLLQCLKGSHIHGGIHDTPALGLSYGDASLAENLASVNIHEPRRVIDDASTMQGNAFATEARLDKDEMQLPINSGAHLTNSVSKQTHCHGFNCASSLESGTQLLCISCGQRNEGDNCTCQLPFQTRKEETISHCGNTHLANPVESSKNQENPVSNQLMEIKLCFDFDADVRFDETGNSQNKKKHTMASQDSQNMLSAVKVVSGEPQRSHDDLADSKKPTSKKKTVFDVTFVKSNVQHALRQKLSQRKKQVGNSERIIEENQDANSVLPDYFEELGTDGGILFMLNSNAVHQTDSSCMPSQDNRNSVEHPTDPDLCSSSLPDPSPAHMTSGSMSPTVPEFFVPNLFDFMPYLEDLDFDDFEQPVDCRSDLLHSSATDMCQDRPIDLTMRNLDIPSGKSHEVYVQEASHLHKKEFETLQFIPEFSQSLDCHETKYPCGKTQHSSPQQTLDVCPDPQTSARYLSQTRDNYVPGFQNQNQNPNPRPNKQNSLYPQTSAHDISEYAANAQEISFQEQQYAESQILEDVDVTIDPRLGPVKPAWIMYSYDISRLVPIHKQVNSLITSKDKKSCSHIENTDCSDDPDTASKSIPAKRWAISPLGFAYSTTRIHQPEAVDLPLPHPPPAHSSRGNGYYQPLSWCEFSEAELDSILVELMNKHSKHIGRDLNMYTLDELTDMEESDIEISSIAEQNFGKTKRLSPKAARQMFKETGVDSSGWLAWMEFNAYIVDESYRSMILFFKSIPGFKELPREDKFILAKSGVFAYDILSSFRGYTRKSNMVLNHHKVVHKKSDLFSIPNLRDVLSLSFAIARDLEDLDLRLDEIIVLKAIVVTTPAHIVFISCYPSTDQINQCLSDVKKVEYLNRRLHCCLQLLLQRHHQDPDQRYTNIISVMPHMRDLRNAQLAFIKMKGDIILREINAVNAPLFKELKFTS